MEVTGGTPNEDGVINYTVGLDYDTKKVIDGAVTEVEDSDTIDFTKTGNVITAEVISGTSKVVAGRAVTTEENKVATVDDIVDTINNVSWDVKSVGVDGGESTYKVTDKSNIKAGDTLNVDAGKNITISGEGGQLIIATKDDVEFTNLTVTGDTKVNNFAVDAGATIDMGGNKITNVGAGDADTDAVNVSQLKDAVEKAKAVEKVVKAEAAVGDVNLAEIATESGKAAGEANETYKVSVSKKAVQDAAKEAIDVTGDNKAITVTNVTDPATGQKTFTVEYNGDEAAKTTPLTYKVNGQNDQTVTLEKGLNFVNGTHTVASVAENGEVKFDLTDAAKDQLKKEETVKPGASGLVTIDDTKQNNTGGTEFVVDVKKATFDTVTVSDDGEINAPNTDGVVTGNDLQKVINQGFWTAKVDNANDMKVKFGDSINFADGKGTDANVTAEGSITFNVKTDDTTIKVGEDGNLTVNLEGLPRTKLIDGKNTTVTGDGVNQAYQVNVEGDLSGITSISNGDTAIKLGDATVNVGDAKITNVKDGTEDGDVVNVKQLKASKEEVVSTDGSVKVDSTGTTADDAKKFDLSVNADGITIVKNENGQLTVNVTPLTNKDNGEVNVPTGDDAGKLATAADIANAINNSGFTVKANSEATGEVVNPGDTVDFIQGRNINITRSGTAFTVATVDTPVFKSVQFNENGPIIKADVNNNINIGKADGTPTKIVNVEAGTNATDAVNVSQLKDAVEKAKAVESVVADTSSENIAKVTTKSGKDAGQPNEQYTVSVTKADVAKVAQDAIDVKGTGLAKVTSETKDGVETFTVDVNKGEFNSVTSGGKLAPTQKDGVATVGDVIDAVNKGYWIAKDDNGNSTNVKFGDAVLFADGKGTNAKLTGNTVTFDVNTTTLGTVTTADSPIRGSFVVPTTANSFVTADVLATALNQSGWRVTAGAASGGTAEGVSDHLVKPGSQVELITGENIKIVQKDGKFTISTTAAANGEPGSQGPVGPQGPEGKPGKDGAPGTIVSVAKDTDAGKTTITTTDPATGKSNEVTVLDGKDGAPGKDGQSPKVETEKVGDTTTITFTNPDGTPAVATIKDGANGKDGAPGKDGKDGKSPVVKAEKTDGVTKITVDNKDGSTPVIVEVKDSKDGAASGKLNFKGDTKGVVVRDLGTTLNVVGGADTTKLSDNNIGVVSDNGKLEVKLAKDIAVDSVTANTVNVGPVTMTAKTVANPDGTTTNELSIGSEVSPSRITNVANGKNPNDAVNVSQLTGAVTNINNRMDGIEGRINDLDDKVSGLGAISAASASLPQVYLPGKSMLAVAAGGYSDQQAVAVGFSSTSDNGRLLMKIQGSASTNGEASGGVGVGWMW
ncbi:YadA-like family protein [Moraxella sp. FZFQ2102]|uniref:YadA-like family protein n=1 Tax=Moraxella sp. FZFQ2102 TaxID=2953752 RepID=UPI00209C3E6E|nr:YadA-like family protein [Moraxella sp. FZFQ2102]USZ15890.1 YadA-like family protein [Moraxella sp. FZFQ2102]